MKSPTAIFVLLCVMLATTFAQQGRESVAVEFKGVSVAFHANPPSVDAKLLPFIEGRVANKERFGFCFGGAASASKAIEILDKDGNVLKSVTVGEFLGGKGNGFSLVSEPPAGSQLRWLENKYALDLPNDRVQLIVKTLATGSSAADEHLVVTFALRSEAGNSLGLRVSLPAAGNIEAKSGGLVLSSKSGSAAVAAALYPNSATSSVTKSLATFTSAPKRLEAATETAVLWLVLDGVASGAGPGMSAKVAAAKLLSEKRFGESDPRIVVVSHTDKPSTQPGDVVTYSLVCRNIGTGEATDVTLSNPVSDGLQYLEGSATSDGSSVTFDQKGVGGPVRNINWKFQSPIKPGEERQVTFKVKVL